MKCCSLVRMFSVAAVIVSFAAGCNRGGAPDEKTGNKPIPSVKIATVESDGISRALETTGEVIAPDTVTISSTVEGTISFCPWREGDRIERAGEKLIEIDRALYREERNAAVSSRGTAEARLIDLLSGTRPEEIAQAAEAVKDMEHSAEFANTDMGRIKKLVESGGLPAEALDKARVTYTSLNAKLAAARERLAMLEAGPTTTSVAVQRAQVREAGARVEQADAKLAESIITAPFPGVILKAHVRRGDMASPREPLLEIADLSFLIIRFQVPESGAATIRENMDVSVTFDSYPGKEFKASIARIYPELNQRTRTRTVEARLNDDVEIVPGMFARLKVMTETVPDAVVVPGEAVVSTPAGKQAVFVVENGKAVMRVVETGIEQGNRIQIVNGVKPGEKVVIAGNEKLKDGAEVKIADGGGKPGMKEMPIKNKSQSGAGALPGETPDAGGGGKQ